MIPKIIHYCWFGGNPLPELAKKCIESWKKYLPDYEIKEWNESNFDVNSIPYTKEAYEEKKYAFVSDYARFWILYTYGGVYFDTDVEVIKNMDDILARGPFMGCERDFNPQTKESATVAPGLGLAVNPGLGLYKEIVDLYGTLHFLKEDKSLNLTTVVDYTTNLLRTKGLEDKEGIQCVEEVWIYPKEYFQPMDFNDNKFYLTSNTLSIHHYSNSWASSYVKYRHYFKLLLIKLFGSSWGVKIADLLCRRK